MNVNGLYELDLTDAAWRKSSHTANNDQCVEIADAIELPIVAVRDSKNPHIPPARVSSGGWNAFVRAAKHGDLRSV